MYPISQNEKLIETKSCKRCQISFPITDKDLEFYDKVSPVFNWQKFFIPTPTLCPDCRQQRRLAFRNERKLYKRKCDATWKEIISVYSPQESYKVFNNDYWWSDNWNAWDYWMNLDFSKNFFRQFTELQSNVPKLAMITMPGINSDYTNYASGLKNCYLLFDSTNNENCLYGYNMSFSDSSIDINTWWYLHGCYECIGCFNCFDILFSQNSNNCKNCYFLFNCQNCTDCFLCFNITNKQFCINNIQYSENEYFEKKQELLVNLIQTKKIYFERKREVIQKSINTIACENVTWDDLKNCSNAVSSFSSFDCRDIKYCTNSEYLSDCYDYNSTSWPWELCLEVISTGGKAYNVVFSSVSNGTRGIYLDHCIDCSDCFGCIGLRNKQYCILNKQYTKEQYEELVPKIIEHMQKTWEWWEFFPASLSPFWYNETAASEYFPLEKSEALKLGFNWSDYEAPFPKVEKIIPASKLPDDISKIPDDILNWAIECEVSNKLFRIIKQELEFYRKHNLPIPRRHPDQRHKDRMALRNPRKLFERKCDKCHKDILTTYSPERTEIVYCEECYDSHMIW